MPRKHSRNQQYECCYCHEIIVGRNALGRHKHEKHSEMLGQVWNKGKTKETDFRVAKGVQTLKHHLDDGTVKIWSTGKSLPNDIREKISESMKLAHKEGRAHNIGECRWNNEPSYPEKWFMQVIENEFEDKNYQREFPFHRFSLDFVWIHKKKCIEIDGEQHQKDPKQQERDRNKDNLLKEDGWKLLRLDWKWVCNNTKEAIKLAKDFIDLNQAFVDKGPIA